MDHGDQHNLHLREWQSLVQLNLRTDTIFLVQATACQEWFLGLLPVYLVRDEPLPPPYFILSDTCRITYSHFSTLVLGNHPDFDLSPRRTLSPTSFTTEVYHMDGKGEDG